MILWILRIKHLFQDPVENLSRAYGPVSMVERVRVGLLTETYYKVSIDASFGTGSSDELFMVIFLFMQILKMLVSWSSTNLY